MSTNVTPQEVMNNIISKCWEDADFKSQLIKDPVATIEKFTGEPVALPEGMKLVVNDQSQDSNVTYLNIPAEPNLEDLELTDEQLELVSGGSSPYCFATIIVILTKL